MFENNGRLKFFMIGIIGIVLLVAITLLAMDRLPGIQTRFLQNGRNQMTVEQVPPANWPPDECSVPPTETGVVSYVSKDQRTNQQSGKDLDTAFVMIQDLSNPPPPGEEASFPCEAVVTINGRKLKKSPFGSIYSSTDINLILGEVNKLEIDFKGNKTVDIQGTVKISKISNINVNHNPMVPKVTIKWDDAGNYKKTTNTIMIMNDADPSKADKYTYKDVTGIKEVTFDLNDIPPYFNASQYYVNTNTKTTGNINLSSPSRFEGSWISELPHYKYPPLKML